MKGPLLRNKVHLLKQKVHCYNYTKVVLHAKLAEQAGQFTLDDVSEGIREKLVRPYRDVRIGLADSAAARLKFHPQLKNNCDQLSK